MSKVVTCTNYDQKCELDEQKFVSMLYYMFFKKLKHASGIILVQATD